MTVTENDRFPKIKKRFQRQLLQSDAKTENTYTSTHQLLTNYFSTFYGKKLAFSSGFLYLCTGNRKNSLLAKSRSSMTTEAGLNRWQAPVIKEDHKMGRKRLSGELWFKELLNADWAWSTLRTFKTSRKTPALQTSGESYSSPSTLQLSNPISLALSGPKVK